jgi:hypothetical protein
MLQLRCGARHRIPKITDTAVPCLANATSQYLQQRSTQLDETGDGMKRRNRFWRYLLPPLVPRALGIGFAAELNPAAVVYKSAGPSRGAPVDARGAKCRRCRRPHEARLLHGLYQWTKGNHFSRIIPTTAISWSRARWRDRDRN